MLPDVKVKITKIQKVTKLPSEIFERVMKEGTVVERSRSRASWLDAGGLN